MIKLINDDCLNALDKISNNSIDVIITSPPYNKAGYEGFIRKSHNKDSWKRRNIDYQDNPYSDFMEDSKYQDWQIKILNKCYDLLKDDGSIFYNHKIRVAKHKASHPIEWLLKTKLIFRQQIVWNRKASPTVAPIRYIPNTELIFWLTKNQKQPNFVYKLIFIAQKSFFCNFLLFFDVFFRLNKSNINYEYHNILTF